MVLYKKIENPGDRKVPLSIGFACEIFFIDHKNMRD